MKVKKLKLLAYVANLIYFHELKAKIVRKIDRQREREREKANESLKNVVFVHTHSIPKRSKNTS